MKKSILVTGTLCVLGLGMLSSCGVNVGKGGISLGKELHLSKSEDISTIVKQVKEKAGGKVMLDEALIFTEDGSDAISHATFKYQDPKDPNGIMELIYYPKDSRWVGPNKMEITVYGGNAEEYRVSDDVADIDMVQFALIPKLLQDARAKNQGEININPGGYHVRVTCEENKPELTKFSLSMEGKLKSNGVKKDVSYDTDYQGKAQEG